MVRKVSLRFYIQEKKKIKYELCYRNNRNSLFLARARTNTIKLEDHKGRGLVGYDKTCKLCKEDKEDLVHFIINCRGLEEARNYNLLDRNIKNPEKRMRKLLFRDNRFQEIGNMIKNLWTKRKKLLDITKKRQQANIPNTVIDARNSIHSRNRCASDPGPSKGGSGYFKHRHRHSSLSRG